MIGRKTAFVFLAWGAFGAQAQTPNPILHPGHLWAFDAFALTPPEGEWASLSKTRSRAVFVQKPWNEATLVAAVVAEPFDGGFASAEEFLAHARKRRGRSIEGQPYKIVRQEETLETGVGGYWCTQYSALGSEQGSFFGAAWFIDIAGRSCWHKEAKLIVDLSMSSRIRAGEADMPFSALSAAYFDSLQFRSAPTQAIDVPTLRALAERGDASAALRLAIMYAHGHGVAATDVLQAEHWYRTAAEAGEMDAQYNLGLLHLQGALGKRDVGQALKWLGRAADQRDAQAQFNLAQVFYEGLEGEPDFSEAYYWFRVAAANGHERAKRRLQALPKDLIPAEEEKAPAAP